MLVELKNWKLCNKLHRDTSMYVITDTRARTCKSEICVEVRRFTVNKSHLLSH